jgi:hypothetical protein
MGGIDLRSAQSTWEMPLPRATPPSARDASRRELAKYEGSTSAKSERWNMHIKCSSVNLHNRCIFAGLRRKYTLLRTRAIFHNNK